MTAAHTAPATVDHALFAIEEEIAVLKQTYEESPTLTALILARRSIRTLQRKLNPDAWPSEEPPQGRPRKGLGL